MEIHHGGSGPARRGAAAWFFGTGWAGPLPRHARARARALLRRALRAWRAHELAYASVRADIVHPFWNGPCSEFGRALAGSQRWRRGLDSARGETLAWRKSGEHHGARRHRRNTRRKICRLAGESDGSTVHNWRIALRAAREGQLSGGPGQASIDHGTVITFCRATRCRAGPAI